MTACAPLTMPRLSIKPLLATSTMMLLPIQVLATSQVAERREAVGLDSGFLRNLRSRIRQQELLRQQAYERHL